MFSKRQRAMFDLIDALKEPLKHLSHLTEEEVDERLEIIFGTDYDDKYSKRIKEETCNLDRENGHIQADGLLCDLLIDLGYKKTVEAYKKVDKWYA